jgi:hypothetical protein
MHESMCAIKYVLAILGGFRICCQYNFFKIFINFLYLCNFLLPSMKIIATWHHKRWWASWKYDVVSRK